MATDISKPEWDTATAAWSAETHLDNIKRQTDSPHPPQEAPVLAWNAAAARRKLAGMRRGRSAVESIVDSLVDGEASVDDALDSIGGWCP